MKRAPIIFAAALLFFSCVYPGRWPNATIPYALIGFSHDEEATVLTSMLIWEQTTGVNFKNVLFEDNDDDTSVLHIVKGKSNSTMGGLSICGYQDDMLHVVIIHDVTSQIAVHEFGHVLGLDHEHQRPDRDSHIMINWDNLIDESSFLMQFIKRTPKNFDYNQYEYDYYSCMHYPNNSCAIDSEIETIVSPVPVGIYDVPSLLDIKKVKAIQGTDDTTASQ
ncbi:MAG: hypothetical protein JW838_00120 [Spirochaetes bacterium]|nr:hypothetical protein [Spirochaetota bacterium]